MCDVVVAENLELAPPEGGRIEILRVSVQMDRDWQQAINAAGPKTLNNCNVREVGDQYPPAGQGTLETEIILMNFGLKEGSWERALSWAKKHGLKRTSPRQVFSIGEHKPQLHHELGMRLMYVVATEDCTFGGRREACYVWWSVSGRLCGLYWLEYDGGGSGGWFAFLRE